MTDSPQIDRRTEALRLLDEATKLAECGKFDAAETVLGLSQEHMAHATLEAREAQVEEIKTHIQVQMLAANDPEGPHGQGCSCGA